MSSLDKLVEKNRLEKQSEEEQDDELSLFQRAINLLSRPGQISPKLIEQKVYEQQNPERKADSLKLAKTFFTGNLEEDQKDIPIAQLAEQISPVSAAKTLFLGKPTKSKLSTHSQALEKAGVGELGSISIPTQDAFSKELSKFEESQGREAIPKKKPYKITGRDAIGFAADVALDPSTYIGGGVAKGAVKVGGTALSSAGKKALQGMAKQSAKEIGESLAKKTISKTAQELAEAGEKKAFRDMARLLPVKKEFIDRGGIKFAGKTIVPRETIEKASSAAGEILDKIPGVEKTKQTVKGLFQRDAILPEKAKDLMQEYYNKVDYNTSKTIDKLKDALTVNDAPVSEQQRRAIFGALTKAEDESVSLLSDRMAKIQKEKDLYKKISKEASPLLKEFKNLLREENKLSLDNALLKIKGIGPGRIKKLKENGIDSIQKFASTDPQKILKIFNSNVLSIAKRIGRNTAENMIDQARKLSYAGDLTVNWENALRDIVGIGPKREQFLKFAGIENIEDVARMQPTQLLSALDKSAKGLGIMRIAAKKELAEKAKLAALEIIKENKEKLPNILKEKQKIIQNLKSIRVLVDEDSTKETIDLAKAALNEYINILKKTGIEEKEFDKILYKNINSLPKELQDPARKIALSLKQAAKRDSKAGILNKFIPNYVPRKYVDLNLPLKGPSTGVGGTLIKTLGGRSKARKIGSTEEARQFAASKGGELVEDISIPVAERLIRGEKAIAGRQLVDRFKQEFGKKDYTGKLKLPDYIEKHLQQITSRGISDEATSNALKAYDKYLNFHKSFITGLFPKFHARNIVSNRFLSALGSGFNAIDPRTIKRGWDLSKGKKGQIVTDLGKIVPYDTIREMAKKYGASKGYFLGDITQTIPEMLGKKNKINLLQRGRDVGQAIEDADRMGLFATFVKQGKPYKQAAEEVNRFMFDYQNLSNFEKSTMKRIFPFYTFSRKSLGLFSKELLKQPRMFASIPDFINFLSQEDMQPQDIAKLPDYLQDKILINIGNNQVVSGLDLGFEQLLSMGDNPEKVLSQITPPLKVILENFSDKNYFRGTDLTTAAKNITDMPPVMLKALSPVIGLKEETRPIYKDGKRTGAKKIVYSATNPKTLNFIRNLPISRLGGEASQLIKPGETVIQKAIRALTGYAVQDVDPGLIEYLNKKEKLKKLEQEGKIKKFEKYYIPKQERGKADLKTIKLVR